MIREFLEETGFRTTINEWSHYAYFTGCRDEEDYECMCYVGHMGELRCSGRRPTRSGDRSIVFAFHHPYRMDDTCNGSC